MSQNRISNLADVRVAHHVDLRRRPGDVPYPHADIVDSKRGAKRHRRKQQERSRHRHMLKQLDKRAPYLTSTIDYLIKFHR